MTIRLYPICEEELKVIRAHVPHLAKLKRWQFSTARHALDLLGAATEDLGHIMNVQNTLLGPHAISFSQKNVRWKWRMGLV
jgi:hypothetical protein